MLILYAVTPAFTENVLPLYPALQQRLGNPIQYLSAHNPKAPVIDLEALDFEPRRLLVEVGGASCASRRRAYDWSPDDTTAQINLERLAALVTEEQLEAGIGASSSSCGFGLLDQQRLGGERELEAGELEGLVRGEEALVLEEIAEEPDGMFLGLPLRKKSVAMGYFDRDLPDDLAHLIRGAEDRCRSTSYVPSSKPTSARPPATSCTRWARRRSPSERWRRCIARRSTVRAVAIKVRRSDVADRLGRGLDALPEPVADCVRQECDYALAAQRQERFWWLYAGHAGVVVPALKRAYSGARVLTTERMQGVSLDKFVASGPSQETRDRAGAALFDYYVGTLFEQGDYDCRSRSR